MPSSALSYYLSVLANARLVKLHLDNGYNANYEAERFVHDVEAGHYFYPKTFAREIPVGRKLKFRYPIVPLLKIRAENLCWWGRIGANTHFNYKSYPCSAVYAYRVLTDLGRRPPERGAEVEVFPDDWDLPEAIMPQGVNLTPNENLQGWSPSTILSHTQRAFLFEAVVEEGIFPVDIPDWSYNKRLMTAVSIELENLQQIAPGDNPISDTGSQGQLTFSVPEYACPRVEKLLDFEGRSNTAIVEPISMMGIRHMYRVRHTTRDNNKQKKMQIET